MNIQKEPFLPYGKQNINSSDIFNKLLKTLYIRHTKDNIKEQLNIPSVIEENIFLEFTDPPYITL